MKMTHSKRITKYIILILTVLMLCVFCVPKYVYADTKTSFGGILVRSISKVVVFLCDEVMQWMQDIFVSQEEIETEDETYNFQYSPAIIFSGTVPALDINFIEPIKKDDEETGGSGGTSEDGGEFTESGIKARVSDYFNNSNSISESEYNSIPNSLGTYQSFSGDVTADNLVEQYESNTYTAYYKGHHLVVLFKKEHIGYMNKNTYTYHVYERGTAETDGESDKEFTEEGVKSQLEYYFNRSTIINQTKYESLDAELKKDSNFKFFSKNITVEGHGKTILCKAYYGKKVVILFDEQHIVRADEKWYVYEGSEIGESKEYVSTAEVLQRTISTWYKALRRIALVGLLSVLVYIGIRIVLTSTSPQEQSKYKKMMADWFVALCLLFTLHYIMSLILTVVQEVSKIFNPGDTDALLNTLRYDIAHAKGSETWGVVAAQTIMYTTLTILTVIFTAKYLKRVVYMAFFTMIAPLIALTYPLDKIKDGQAQAFGMWMKEYTFSALIQVVHLIIYYVLVGSAMRLVGTYPLYAIAALIFMKQAEDLVKRMFGFDKAETVNALGAAVTGGLISNAITQIKQGSGSKQEGNKEEGSKPARTKNDPLAGLRNSGGGGENTSNQGGNNNATPPQTAGGTGNEEAPIETRAAEAFGEGGQPEGAAPGNTRGNNNAEETESEPQTKPKRNIARGVTALGRRYLGPGVRAIGGIAGTVVGAAVGFSAGVAQGDFSKAIGGLAGGAVAGRAVGRRMAGLPEDVFNAGKGAVVGIRDTFREGKYGEDTMKQLTDAGITNKKDIEKIIENGNGDISKEIGYYTLAKKCPRQIYDDDQKFDEYLKNLGISESNAREIREKMRRYI